MRPSMPPSPARVERLCICGQEVLCSSVYISGHGAFHRHNTEKKLVEMLLDRVSSDYHCHSQVSGELTLTKSPLGKPVLRVGTSRGPSVSFSGFDGLIWGAVCGSGSEIGLDVACRSEFAGEYPFYRIWNRYENSCAERLTGNDVSEAAAMIWSVKESYVKALGCGFHLFDPLQVRIEERPQSGGTTSFLVWLSEEGQEKLSTFLSRERIPIGYDSSFPELFERTSSRSVSVAASEKRIAYSESRRVDSKWLSVTVFDISPFVE